MKKIYIVALTLLALTLPKFAFAQNLTSAYFADGYAYGHQLNPAKEYDRKGYFSMPILLGQINAGLKGNLGLGDLVYKNPNGSGLVTYLHPSLSKDKALSGFNRNNKLLEDTRYNLLSFGFHSGRSGYQTFTLGVREHAGINIPGALFSMTRELTNKDYNFSSFGATANAWAEVGWSYSREAMEGLRVGGKLNFLIGGAYVDLHMDRLDLNLADENRWTAIANATMEVAVPGFSWGDPEIKEYSEAYRKRYEELHPGQKAPTHYEALSFDNADFEEDFKGSQVMGNYGIGIDLGAEADLGKMGIVPGLKVGASLLDLGFIRYKNVGIARNRCEEFEFEGFKDIPVGDGEGYDFDDQLDDLGDRFENLICLQDGGTGARGKGLGSTLNLSAEYTPVRCPKISLGFLSTTRIQGQYSWNEERLSVNLHPLKAFEFILTGGVGTLGPSVGWMFNFHPRVFNFYIGSDHLIGKLTKQGIPLRSNADLEMGINFPIGKSHVDRKRAKKND